MINELYKINCSKESEFDSCVKQLLSYLTVEALLLLLLLFCFHHMD